MDGLSTTVDVWLQSVAKAGVMRSYILASTFRSGSTYLAEIIERNKHIANLTKEAFANYSALWPANGVDFSSDEVRIAFSETLNASRDGIFATKLMWPHLNEVARLLKLSRKHSFKFHEVFPNGEWIYVFRRDIFAQAVSFWRAKNTGHWHVYEALPAPEVKYNFLEIDACLRELCSHYYLWEDFFLVSGICPIRICYEDVLEFGENYLDEQFASSRLGRSAGRLQLAVPLKRQHDSHSVEFRDRFLEDLYRLGR